MGIQPIGEEFPKADDHHEAEHKDGDLLRMLATTTYMSGQQWDTTHLTGTALGSM
jgi:hypothetical protein